jgi:hypothetical protein
VSPTRALAALALATLTTATPARAQAPTAPPTRALTSLTDARACAPLTAGGFAVATGGGLALLAKDGTSRTLTSIDGLPETRVHAVVEQGAGVWVGTEAGAAYVSLSAEPRVTRTALTAPVHAIHVSPSGAVYLGTRGAGVYRLAAADAAPELVRSSVKGTHVAAITEHAGALHVAYADGPLARLDGGLLKGVDRSPTHGQALATVGAELLLGDLEGLFRVDATGVTAIASVDARALASTSSGSLLVATWGSGLMQGTTRGALRADALVPRLARGVATRGAARCVATTEGAFLDDGAGAFRKAPLGGPTSNDVTALAASKSGDATGPRIAIGTFESGASLYENGTLTRIHGIDRTETVNGLAWQGDRLWLATVHGLVRVAPDGTTRRFTSHDGLPSSFSRSIHVLSTNRVLVGTESGAAFVDGERVTPLLPFEKGKAVPIASPMHATWALASSADGTLYVGTAAGLYYGKDGAFERASLATGALEDDWVTALAVDGRDVLVGTYSKGVTRLHFDGAKSKPAPTHLGGGYVNADGLVIEGGKLYVATMDSLLVRPLAATDDAAKWEPLPSAAPGRDVTAVRFVAGERWVSSRRGLGITR